MPIVERITTTFSTPGEHVVLIDAGTDASTASAVSATTGTVRAATTGEGVPAALREVVRALGRTVTATVMDTRPDAAVTPARPFWADLVAGSAAPTATHADPTTHPARAAGLNQHDVPGPMSAGRADLVLVSLPPHAAERVPLDRLALLAAGLLRYGGIFAVYTHSDWNEGRLLDPTGAIVAGAQHADLLYLQHIVALHTPVRDGRLHAAPSAAVAAEYDRTVYRATVRRLPAPHLRSHGDVLAFAQPADPGTPPLATAAEASAAGDEPGHGEHR